MANSLPPIPNQPVSDTHEWRDWFFKVYQNLNGASGTFTSADGKTITVTNGIITSIV